MDMISGQINDVEQSVKESGKLYQQALKAINSKESAKFGKEMERMQREIGEDMDAVRGGLAKVAAETKRINGPEVASRKAQQASSAKRFNIM
jgi:predicted negative regulator of RcsB-dependent stress response